MSAQPPTEPSIARLGAYCSGIDIDSAPADIIELAKLKILDSFACALLALDSDQSRVALRVAHRFEPGECGLMNLGPPLQMMDAAFINSVLIHAILQDDVDLTIGHPACTVIPAALAAGAHRNASGADIVAAIIAGYEAMWCVAGHGAFMVPTIARGFRGNTIVGAFGAAAAAARSWRLDPNATTNAIAATASFTAGLLKPLNAGTMERSFQQASNTRNGILAALLASEGLIACDTVLSGSGGLYASFMGSDAFPVESMDALGRSFRMPETFAKPYPSAGSNTVGIAVLDHLLAAHECGQDLTALRVEVIPRFTGNPGYPAIANAGPFNSLEHALISFPFGLSCLAVFGEVSLATLRAGLNDARVSNLAAKIELVPSETPHPLWCRITATTRGGNTFVATSDDIDWKRFYLDRATAVAKFLSAAAGIVPDAIAQKIVDLTLDLERLSSIRLLNDLLGVAHKERLS